MNHASRVISIMLKEIGSFVSSAVLLECLLCARHCFGLLISTFSLF